MSKRFVSFKKIAEGLLAVLACLLLVTSVSVLYIFWKLSHGPVDMSWAEPYIQSALGGDKPGVEVKTQGIVAEWKNFESPLTLGIADLSITDHGNEVLSVSEAGLQLAKAPLFIGIVSPEAIFIKNPNIHFEKSEDGRLSFLIANHQPQQQATPAPAQNRMTPQEIGNSFFLGGFLRNQSGLPLSRLQSFVIENAAITIDDKSQNKSFELPNANLTLSRDVDNFNLVLDYQTKDKDRAKINAVVVRKPLAKEIKFILNLTKVETELWALNLPDLPGIMREDYGFDGQITGLFDTDWGLKNLDGAITTSYKNEQKQKFGIAATRDPKTGIIPVELTLAEVSLDQIASVWPEELSHLHITEWFTKKLSKGIIKNFAVKIPFKDENGKWTIAGFADGKFDFENLTCDYRAPLYPLSEGYGHAVIADDTLTVTIDKAKLVDMDVKNGSVTVTKLTAGADEIGQATVKLNLKGPLSTGFKYISLEPISLGDKIKMDPAKVEGQGDINVTVTFPTLHDLPADQVVAIIDATLTDTKLPGIVHGMDLSGGPLNLKVEKGNFSITGKGALDGTPIDFLYSEYLDPATAPFASQVHAKLIADDTMRAKFGINVSDYISGKAGVDVSYLQYADKTARLDIKADLTPGQTYIKPLNYFKKEGVSGTAAATLHLKGDGIQKVSDLNVTIGKDQATGGQLIFGMVGKENDVTSGSFEKVKLGDANDFKLKIEQANGTQKISAQGASIDARAFMNGSNQSSKARTHDIEMDIDTASMRMGDAPDQVLKNPKMRVVVNPEGNVKFLDLKAKVGSGDLALNLSPSPQGVMNLRMDSNDAGATLKTLGAYQNMVGGTLVLSGAQIQGGDINDIQGAALITDFKVVKAPVLAQLIGAFSITGLPDLLANDGISFSKLKSDFIWKVTPGGNRIINLYDGATGGGSVGLTFGGVINQTKKTIDISGTFVPMSQVNKIVSSIPLIGSLLTGGKNGGIIAATYALKGPSDNPSVFVNPLSVLAPGFLRSILFEGGMNSGQDEKPYVPKRRQQQKQATAN